MDSWEGDQECALYIGLLVKVIQYDLGLSFQILDFIGLPGIVFVFQGNCIWGNKMFSSYLPNACCPPLLARCHARKCTRSLALEKPVFQVPWFTNGITDGHHSQRPLTGGFPHWERLWGLGVMAQQVRVPTVLPRTRVMFSEPSRAVHCNSYSWGPDALFGAHSHSHSLMHPHKKTNTQNN